MNKLTKLNKWFILYVFILILITGFLLYYLFTYKIAITTKVKIKVGSNNEYQILADSNVIYELKKNQEVILKFQNKYYELKIKHIEIVNGLANIKFYNIPKNIKLLDNTLIDAVISHDQTNIFKIITNFA